jgi:hypothetical protein
MRTVAAATCRSTGTGLYTSAESAYGFVAPIPMACFLLRLLQGKAQAAD